jgi:predicted nicotinamide N-methyase
VDRRIDPARFIETHLPLSPVPDLPGVRLHLAAPTSRLSRLTDVTPYWAYVWAGGLALARHVQDHPERVAGRRVLDLGAGSGLVGIVAALADARVMAAENDPLGRVAIGLNAAANGVTVNLLQQDMVAGDPSDVDLILAGDVFYDPALVTPMLAFLGRAGAQGIPCLIGDPERAPLPLHRLEPIAAYQVRDFGQVAPVTSTVYRLRDAL